MADFNDIDSLVDYLSNINEFIKKKSDSKLASTSIHENEDLRSDLKRTEIDEVALNKKLHINPSIEKQRKKLPIFQQKDELIQAIVENQVLIVIGETGSGKTTQIPQYLVEAGFAVTGRIGCTQLRRMAARRVAIRVAEEFGCELGEEVGFTVRFEDSTSGHTKIQYMTDGILVRECMHDKTLSSYSAIILDESHERTMQTDVLLAVLKYVTGKRDDLKLIISSATLEARKFSTYFYNAEIFHITGKMYPVEIIYNNCTMSYIDLAIQTVIKINEEDESGDILIFLTGEYDIDTVSDQLENNYKRSSQSFLKLKLLPVYSMLPWKKQARIFKPAKKGYRKVIVATNIAETSLTLDGIRYVIDAGYVKQKIYDPKKQIEILEPVKISQAQAVQRTGRAGRTEPGICYRLYSKNTFLEFSVSTHPEIKRSNLTDQVLLLKNMGFNNIFEFEFLDVPPIEMIKEAMRDLKRFEAIDEEGFITEIGRKMCSFPLDPELAKMLIISEELKCSEEILIIVALLSVNEIFYRNRKKRKQAEKARSKFHTNYGDLVMLMEVYKEWCTYDYNEEWCEKYFINHKRLEEAFCIREQLLDIMKAQKMKIIPSTPDMRPVLKAICAGFFQNVAHKHMNRIGYITLPQQEPVLLHPRSCLLRSKPEWIVYSKIIRTSHEYAILVTPVDVKWLKEFDPVFSISAS